METPPLRLLEHFLYVSLTCKEIQVEVERLRSAKNIFLSRKYIKETLKVISTHSGVNFGSFLLIFFHL